MSTVTPYRLTLLTAILCLCILGAVCAVILLALGVSPGTVATVFGFLAPTIAALVAVYRAEANGVMQATQHAENQRAITAVTSKVDGLQTAAAVAGATAALAAHEQLAEPPPEGASGAS